jgi:hypothetical protein
MLLQLTMFRESPLSSLSFLKQAGMMEMWQNIYTVELLWCHICEAMTHSPDQIQFVCNSGFAVFNVIALILPVTRT